MCVCFWGRHRGLNVAYSWTIWSIVRPSWNGAQSPCSLTPSDCWAMRQLILQLAGVPVYPASSLVNLGNHVLSVLLTVSQHESTCFPPFDSRQLPDGGHETVCFRGIHIHSWCRFALEELLPQNKKLDLKIVCFVDRQCASASSLHMRLRINSPHERWITIQNFSGLCNFWVVLAKMFKFLNQLLIGGPLMI